MQQIAEWLEKLGMSEYTQRFAENDIDVEVLGELTDKDFDRLGVSIGHRRKMMRAIREFAASPVSAVTQRPASATIDTQAAPRDAAERRQVTVMFSDLVGSTALSARMDPEDLREVISAYQKCVAGTVERFDGFVAKYMGDGVLVYFGYPQAHEDDAERAVRAGLELIQAVAGLKTKAPLRTRIGIATGMVVVGDLIGTGSAQEQAVVGETPNLAARLQSIAEPNTVVIAESTRKLLGNLFDLNDLGAQDLKGIGGRVRAWAALRPGSAEGRFEALHASGLTALVGREEELELLSRRWARAKAGEGQVTLEALTEQLAGLASQNPVLMIFEDAHWTDPTSLEAFGRTVDRIKTLPVLLIVTFRPEFNAPWAGRSRVMSLALSRLGEREAAAIIARLVGNKELPADVMAEIVERTDGIPLFVEEMTKAVLEAEGEGDALRTAGAVPSPASSVPASLHASLMARLDRLGPDKEVAQIGAAIGREFSHPLLAAVTRKPEAELGSALDRLIAAGLLFRQGVPPHATYLFKHALVQDAAYGTLLREPRRALHARIADAIEDHFLDIPENQPELLARHCTEAGLIEKAVTMWGKAGQRSLDRSALVEAVGQLRKGLALVANLPGDVTRVQHELDLQISLGKAMIGTKGYHAPETGEAFNRAHRLCEQLDKPPQLVSVLYGQWVHVAAGGDLALARSRAEELLTLGMERNNPVWTVMGCRVSGATCCWLGEWVAARDYLERGLALYDPAHRTSYAELTVDDPHVILLIYLAWTLLCLGYLDQARAKREAALAEARRLSRAFTLAHALSWATHAEAILMGPSGALVHADEMVSLTERQGISYYLQYAIAFQGWCLTMLGQQQKGITLLTQALEAHRRALGPTRLQTLLTLMADAYCKVRQPQDGLRQLVEAISVTDRTQGRYYEAEMHRVRGDLYLSIHDDGAAEASFREAISVAQHQSAKTWELRAAMSMARLWCDQGKREEARELLAPVYGWFTEGFDTRDLKEAKGLLDELSL